jgi:hypothetical protein
MAAIGTVDERFQSNNIDAVAARSRKLPVIARRAKMSAPAHTPPPLVPVNAQLRS